MLIVIEGCDGVGKTTLAHEIDAQLGGTAQRVHHGVPTQPVLIEYTRGLVTYEPFQKDVIVDRFHWGQRVYGPLYRGADDLGASGHRYVDRFLNRRGAVIVNPYASPAVLRGRFAERGEDYLRDADVERVLDAYDYMASISDVPVMRVDTGSPEYDVELFARDVIEVAEQLELIASADYFGEGFAL